jgi:hypothetical protein
MEYINETTLEYPVSYAQILERHPQISFSDVRSVGYMLVQSGVKPVYDANTQKLVENSPRYDGNNWVKVWDVVPLDAITKIRILESQITPRMIREALLGSTKTNSFKGNKTAKQLIQEIEDQITVLQGQL